jgi:hypothetical protein
VNRFLAWAVQVTHGPNDRPSSARVAGLMTVTVLQVVFISASAMLIRRGQVDAFTTIFEANAILTAALLGISQVAKFAKGGKVGEG